MPPTWKKGCYDLIRIHSEAIYKLISSKETESNICTIVKMCSENAPLGLPLHRHGFDSERPNLSVSIISKIQSFFTTSVTESINCLYCKTTVNVLIKGEGPNSPMVGSKCRHHIVKVIFSVRLVAFS